jgi:hypothetical protein
MFKLRRLTRGWVFVGLVLFALLVMSIYPTGGEASSPLAQATVTQTPRGTPILARRAPLATAPSLGAASTFSVLAALSMSAAGAGTTVSGDLGLSPGLASSKTGPWTVGGSQYFGPLSLAFNAQASALSAYANLAGQGSNGVWSASPWSPVPGVWTAASDTTFTGALTLSGSYNDVWVFQVGRDMTFSGSVTMAGNAQPCNVFWQIGRDATIATGTKFIGTLIASRDVSLVSGATVNGRIISLNSSLTTDGNTISGPTCVAGPPSTPTNTPTPLPPTQTAIVPTQTAIAATQTAIAATLAPSLTAIAATLTVIAPTQTVIAATQTAAARTPTPVPIRPAEVPEANTLLLFGGGIGGIATWLGWQLRKARSKH